MQETDLGGKSPVMAKLPQSGTKKTSFFFHKPNLPSSKTKLPSAILFFRRAALELQVTDLGAKSPAMAILPQSGTNMVFSSFHSLL